ncbi:MAG: DUF5320 domain-containing protein [Erysipelotrichaceae bacterium]|nr:DUF5320 domain-containing protein [Erysipelotrichaceae bacterium]
MKRGRGMGNNKVESRRGLGRFNEEMNMFGQGRRPGRRLNCRNEVGCRFNRGNGFEQDITLNDRELLKNKKIELQNKLDFIDNQLNNL